MAARTCCTPGCGRPASITCPTCKQLGAIEEAHFCGNVCFRGFWAEHKLVHKRYKEAQLQAQAIFAAAAAAAVAPGGARPLLRLAVDCAGDFGGKAGPISTRARLPGVRDKCEIAVCARQRARE